MPIHVFECPEHGEFDEILSIKEPVPLFVLCKQQGCARASSKVWRSDTVGSLDEASAGSHEVYYNEQTGMMMHKGAESKDVKEFNKRMDDSGSKKPTRLEWH